MRRRRTLFVDSDILVVGGGMSGCGAKGPQGEAFPWDTAPRYLLRDRDASYGQTFRDRVEAMAIKEVVTQRDHPGRAGRLGFNETGRRLCCAKLSSTKLAQRRSRGRTNRDRQRHLLPARSGGHRVPLAPSLAQRNYERYLALARAEALIGNTVGAENYYQHAEHYFRSMSSDPEAT